MHADLDTIYDLFEDILNVWLSGNDRAPFKVDYLENKFVFWYDPIFLEFLTMSINDFDIYKEDTEGLVDEYCRFIKVKLMNLQ